jgi:hypothetical protein
MRSDISPIVFVSHLAPYSFIKNEANHRVILPDCGADRAPLPLPIPANFAEARVGKNEPRKVRPDASVADKMWPAELFSVERRDSESDRHRSRRKHSPNDTAIRRIVSAKDDRTLNREVDCDDIQFNFSSFVKLLESHWLGV